MSANGKACQYDALEQNRAGLDDHELVLCQFILKRTGPAGFYWSPDSIAETIGHSSWNERRVRRVLKRLTERGLLTARQEGRGRGSRVYRGLDWLAIIEAHRTAMANKGGQSAPLNRGQSAPLNAAKGGQTELKKGGKSCKRRGVDLPPELQNLNYRTSKTKHTTAGAPAREAEPPDNPTVSETVCVSFETKPERRKAENPETEAKFTILAGAYGPQEGFIGKARGLFADCLDEYDEIMRHVNHTAARRAKAKPENVCWLSKYLEGKPWRYEPVPISAAERYEQAKQRYEQTIATFCGPPVPESGPALDRIDVLCDENELRWKAEQRVRDDAARDAAMAALVRRGKPAEPVIDVPIIDVQEHELERIEPEPEPELDPYDEWLRRQRDPEHQAGVQEYKARQREQAQHQRPQREETQADWHRKQAEVRAREVDDVGAFSDIAQDIADAKAKALQAQPYPKREPIIVKKYTEPAPQVSETIEGKIRFLASKGLEGDALLDYVSKADREKRGRVELAELVGRVLGSEVTV